MPDEIRRRRLVIDGEVFYPITDADSVIHLQREITEKLPIVSNTQPQVGTFVPNQVWIDTSGEDQQQSQMVMFSNPTPRSFVLPSTNSEGLIFATTPPSSLIFGDIQSSSNVVFNESEDEEMVFGNSEEKLVFGSGNENQLLFGDSNVEEPLVFNNNQNIDEDESPKGEN